MQVRSINFLVEILIKKLNEQQRENWLNVFRDVCTFVGLVFLLVFFFFSLLIDINYNVGEDILQGAGSMQMKTNRIKELLSKAKRV